MLLLVLGCAGTPVAEQIRKNHVDASALGPAQVDEVASEIEVRTDWSGEDLGKLRLQVAEGLETALNPSGASTARAARFRARYNHQTNSTLGFTMCLVLLVFVGCPTGTAQVDAELELQVGDATYSGKGHGSEMLFYAELPSQGRSESLARSAALAEATSAALRDLLTRVPKQVLK